MLGRLHNTELQALNNTHLAIEVREEEARHEGGSG